MQNIMNTNITNITYEEASDIMFEEEYTREYCDGMPVEARELSYEGFPEHSPELGMTLLARGQGFDPKRGPKYYLYGGHYRMSEHEAGILASEDPGFDHSLLGELICEPLPEAFAFYAANDDEGTSVVVGIYAWGFNAESCGFGNRVGSMIVRTDDPLLQEKFAACGIQVGV